MVQENGTCVPGSVGSLEVIKHVVNDYPAVTLPSGLTFQFTVSCGNVTFPLINTQSHTIYNIPVGTSCTVSEVTPAISCPRGMTPIWTKTFAPPPAPTVVITSGTTTVIATNTFNCVEERGGGVAVTKVVSPDPRGIGHTLQFPMTVTCTGTTPVTYTLIVNGDTSTVPHPVPVGDICKVTEGLMPNLPPGCTWLPPAYSPTTVPIGPGTNVETVTNGYQCKPVPICQSPMVLNADGICVCATGTGPVGGPCVPVPPPPPPVCPLPQVPNADGICMCPAPMQPGPVPGSCICPKGMEDVGGKCVKHEIKPKPEKAKPEKAKRKQKQDQDEPRRRFEPDSLPGNGIPGGGFGGFGGGGRGGPGGSPGGGGRR
jgi:hypothetical protein